MLNKVTDQLLTILRKYKLTPQQVRYIFKQIRLKGKYQIPNRVKELPQYYNPAEIYHVITNEKDPFNILFFKFGCTTGLRIGELCNLMDYHISFDSSQLRVHANLIGNKSKIDREVPITPQLSNLLKMHLNGKKNVYVFGKSNGTKYTTRAMQTRFKNICVRHRLDPKKHNPHCMRHTFATSLRAKGMKLQDIQLLMGHKSIKTTEIYAHMELGHVKDKFIELMGDY